MSQYGYKQTEIGVIPNDWESVALLSKCILLNGLTYTPDDIADNGLLVIRSSNVQNHQLVFSDNVYVDLPVADEKLIRKDDIIICVRNGSAALIGKCAKASRDYAITFGAFMAVLRGENNGYIYQLLQQGTIQKHISKNSGATINQITNGDFKTIFVPFPTDAKEQECIAEALSDVDSMISSLEKLIAKKKAVKQGAMQELLTGKKRLPGFTGEWRSILLEDVCVFYNGGTPSKKRSDWWNGCIPWISSSDLCENSITSVSINRYITQDALDHSATHLCPKNAVSIVSRVGVGKVAVTPCELCTSQDFTTIVSSAHNPYFLAYMLVPIMKDMAMQAQGTSIKGITVEDIAKIKISTPSIKEQNQIVSILSDMDNEIEALEHKLEKMRQIKQGMMQQLLTGKIRLV